MTDFEKTLEDHFGLEGGWFMYDLHRVAQMYGSKWEMDKPETMELIVNKENAGYMYGLCKEILSGGYNTGLKKSGIKKVREAKEQAHAFLWEEANNRETSIERKIELVKLTSKNNN